MAPREERWVRSFVGEEERTISLCPEGLEACRAFVIWRAMLPVPAICLHMNCKVSNEHLQRSIGGGRGERLTATVTILNSRCFVFFVFLKNFDMKDQERA